MKYWKTALAISAALSASLALADDFKTTEGKEYKIREFVQTDSRMASGNNLDTNGREGA